MKNILNLFFCLPFLLTSCATIFLPKKQKVTINTNQDSSIVYLNNDEIGRGKTIKFKTVKSGVKQVVIKTPNHKDTYGVLMPTHRPWGFWIFMIGDIYPTFGVGFLIDLPSNKTVNYDKENNFTITDKLVYKTNANKYIDITNIALDIKDKEKDVKNIYIKYDKNLEKKILDAEKKQETIEAKNEAKSKSKKKSSLSEEDKKLVYDDTKFSFNIYKTLKSTGFIDTINKVFSDDNNTLFLEGIINKVFVYNITTPKNRGPYYKSKLNIKWYIKNSYNEILDSIETKALSGDFISESDYAEGYNIDYKKNYNDMFAKMYGDAIETAYLSLHNNKTFKKALNLETNYNYEGEALSLSSPSSIVSKNSEAPLASVIVKTKGGHGSGFAITNDGYIVTNYHVIAGRLNNKIQPITVINSAGEEMKATLVRYNKYRDIALLKVDDIFEKAFKCTNVKSFKNLQDVYTIGAPKSIELGQSISSGVISNERKNNNNNLLQLGMSVNGGNSGGPLFDAQGTLHGVIVSKLTGQNTEGVSFAIPSYLIQEYLNINFK